MFSKEYWTEKLSEVVVYAAQNPWQFLLNVLIILSPFFAISAFLSWKLVKAIEKEQKDKKIKAKREANIAKTRRNKKES